MAGPSRDTRCIMRSWWCPGTAPATGPGHHHVAAGGRRRRVGQPATAKEEAPAPGTLGPIARYERSVIDRINDFNDPRQEWRRLFSELLGTFSWCWRRLAGA